MPIALTYNLSSTERMLMELALLVKYYFRESFNTLATVLRCLIIELKESTLIRRTRL